MTNLQQQALAPEETDTVRTSVPKKGSDPSLRSITTPILIEISILRRAKPIPDPKTEGSDYCRDRGKTNYCVWNQRINKRIARFLL
jgi:hypothetical protein